MRGKISVALAVLLFLSTGILPTRAEETILKVIQSISTVVTAETKGEQHSESAEMNETQDPIIEDSESDQKLDEIKNETKEETLDENVAQSTGEADGSITESEAELNSANGKEQVAQTEGMDSTSDTNVVLDVKEPINNFDDISTNNHSTDTSDAFVEPLNQSVVYVDAVKGSDDNVGSDAAPLKTIQAAIKKVDGPSGQIELLSDVMLSSYVIIDGKTITIDGGNHTVSRG